MTPWNLPRFKGGRSGRGRRNKYAERFAEGTNVVVLMKRYDPDVAPQPAAWLALSEDERLLLVERYHRRTHIDIPNLRLHATIHAIVENQLAEGYEAARDAFERVRAGGLGRYDAIHAVGSVVAKHVLHLMRDGAGEGDPNAAYDRALRALSADSWRELAE